MTSMGSGFCTSSSGKRWSSSWTAMSTIRLASGGRRVKVRDTGLPELIQRRSARGYQHYTSLQETPSRLQIKEALSDLLEIL
ncbi:unnamed protein product [Sphagnum jensenii]